MSLKVVYIPGFLGSNLVYSLGPDAPFQPLWLDLPSILSGTLAYLQLGIDGVSPGPLAEGVTITPIGIYGPVYAPLYLAMLGFGWDVLPLGWDFRQSVVTQAAVQWPTIQAWAAGQPIYIVAHSQGGLLGRAIYQLMQNGGQDAQLARLVTLCTPHYGTLESARLLWRLPQIYAAIISALGWAAWAQGTPGPAYVDAVLSSWPAVYELMANAAQGPLYDQAPDQAAELYTVDFWQGANPGVTAAALLSAENVQTDLALAVPAGRLVCVAGVGTLTPYQFAPPNFPASPDGYLTTYVGDGLVTALQAELPGVPVLTVLGSHGVVPLLPQVWAALASIVPNGLASSLSA